MSRRQRVDAEGTVHHVVNRGVDHQRIFFNDADRVEFGRLLSEVHDRFGTTVIGYCLMDNHFHLIVRSVDGLLSRSMQHLQSVFAAHVNQRVGRDGHLFRGRFWSSIVQDDEYLLTALRYVERNALDVVGVDRPCGYRWSSHRSHLGLRRSPEWLETDLVRSYFADVEAYAEFIEAQARTVEPHRIDLHRVDDLASLSVAMLADQDVNTAQLTRTVATALVPMLLPENQHSLIQHLGFRDRRAALQAASRARARIAESPSIASAVADLRNLLFDLGHAESALRRTA